MPWQPISEKAFLEICQEQYNELSDSERAIFSRYRVAPWKAKILRSVESGEETVFVVAQSNDGVLYFDDVEYGFNISPIDEVGRIQMPGGGSILFGMQSIYGSPVTQA